MKRLRRCQGIQLAFGPWLWTLLMPSLCLEGYHCWQRLGWCWIWLKCADHSLSMPILAVLKMKLVSRMTVSVNYHCLCLQLTTFSSWQVLLNKRCNCQFLIFFFPKASYQDMLKWKYCHSDFPQKLLRATKPLVPLKWKNLAPSHLVLRGKASQMICDHRNFTLGQLEAGCRPAMSWLLTAETEHLLSGHGLCSSGCQLLWGQKCRTGSGLLCLFQKYILHVRKQQRQQRSPSCTSGRWGKTQKKEFRWQKNE